MEATGSSLATFKVVRSFKRLCSYFLTKRHPLEHELNAQLHDFSTILHTHTHAHTRGIALVLASLGSVLIVYSLVLFIKGFIGASKSREDVGDSHGQASGRRRPRMLCQNCSILYGGRSEATTADGASVSALDCHQSRSASGLTCSECSVRLDKAGRNTHRSNGVYGKDCEVGAGQRLELPEDGAQERPADNGSVGVAREATEAELNRLGDNQERRGEINFDCSLQTVLEVCSNEQQTEGTSDGSSFQGANQGEQPARGAEKGSRNTGAVWRKIAQANGLIGMIKRIAQERGSECKQQLVNKLGSSSSSSSETSAAPRACERPTDCCEPEYLSSRTLRTAQVQM